MTRVQALAIHGSNLLVGGTGLVYAWMCYLAVSDDPYAVVNHPWQPDLQHLHVLTAPLLVFAVGWIWSRHVWARVRSGFAVHRRSGLALTLLFFPMLFSGYLLQVSTGESGRLVWRWVHDCTSMTWVLFAVVHPFLPRRAADMVGAAS